MKARILTVIAVVMALLAVAAQAQAIRRCDPPLLPRPQTTAPAGTAATRRCGTGTRAAAAAQ
jgi:hypothetical protein